MMILQDSFLLQDPKILDSSSQSQDIIHYLEVLIEKMDSLNNLALTYKSHQKNFKVFNKDHELIAFTGLYNITRLLGNFLSCKLAQGFLFSVLEMHIFL